MSLPDRARRPRGGTLESRNGPGHPRRLLYVVNDAGFFLSHRVDLARAAKDSGWDVHVATPPGAVADRVAEAGFAWHAVRLNRFGLRPDRELRSAFSLWRLFRRLRPDIVHLVTLKAVVLGGIAARAARVPARVLALAGLGHVFTGAGASGAALRLAFRLLFPWLAAGRARVVVQNGDDLARLATTGALRRRLVLIPGAGVDLERFRPQPEPTSAVTVLLPARMIWKKGVVDFVAAAELLRRHGVAARFLLAGASDRGHPDAVPEYRLRAWHAAGAVEWLGHREDMPELIAASHVVCLPSCYGEGLPKSLIEAAAAGRAIVATDVPGCRDVVCHGETGLLVPPRDVDALAAALRRLIEDAGLRRRLGACGRQAAERRFGLQDVIEAHLTLYDGLSP